MSRVVRSLLNTLTDGRVRALAAISEIDAVGHRVVHGGPHFEDPVVVTPQVRSAIESVSELAPRQSAITAYVWGDSATAFKTGQRHGLSRNVRTGIAGQ